MFQALAPELSEGLAFDEDFAGLIDHALGDWLVQPTVYDMLEYELPEDIECRLDGAFARFREIHPEAQGYAWFPAAFKGCGGTRMREVLTRRAPDSSVPFTPATAAGPQRDSLPARHCSHSPHGGTNASTT